LRVVVFVRVVVIVVVVEELVVVAVVVVVVLETGPKVVSSFGAKYRLRSCCGGELVVRLSRPCHALGGVSRHSYTFEEGWKMWLAGRWQGNGNNIHVRLGSRGNVYHPSQAATASYS